MPLLPSAELLGSSCLAFPSLLLLCSSEPLAKPVLCRRVPPVSPSHVPVSPAPNSCALPGGPTFPVPAVLHREVPRCCHQRAPEYLSVPCLELPPQRPIPGAPEFLHIPAPSSLGVPSSSPRSPVPQRPPPIPFSISLRVPGRLPALLGVSLDVPVPFAAVPRGSFALPSLSLPSGPLRARSRFLSPPVPERGRDSPTHSLASRAVARCQGRS